MVGERMVAAAKVTTYLLDLGHPTGASKARFLIRFGFDPAQPEALIEALRRHPDDNDVIETQMTEHGVRNVVQCRVRTPDGRDPCIRTVWILDTGSSVHRCVTAYPASPSE